MKLTLSEIVDIEKALQVADSQIVNHMGQLINRDRPQLSDDQIAARLTYRLVGLNSFSMDRVITSARRNWRRK